MEQQTSTQFIALSESLLYPFSQDERLLDVLILLATELLSLLGERCLYKPPKANGNAASSRTNSNRRRNTQCT